MAIVNKLANEDDADTEEHATDPLNWDHFFKTAGIGHPSGPGKGLHRAPHPFGSKEFGAHFWAVLIGNNQYTKPTNKLDGCINDCNLVAGYLHNYLQVLPSHVVHLSNASYNDIITALHNLCDSPDIQKGDNLLFFYSGHGSYHVSSSTKVNAICSIDRGIGGTQDITMLEIGLIFANLQRTKGNNVTAIFDCCHSGDTSDSC